MVRRHSSNEWSQTHRWSEHERDIARSKAASKVRSASYLRERERQGISRDRLGRVVKDQAVVCPTPVRSGENHFFYYSLLLGQIAETLLYDVSQTLAEAVLPGSAHRQRIKSVCLVVRLCLSWACVFPCSSMSIWSSSCFCDAYWRWSSRQRRRHQPKNDSCLVGHASILSFSHTVYALLMPLR